MRVHRTIPFICTEERDHGKCELVTLDRSFIKRKRAKISWPWRFASQHLLFTLCISSFSLDKAKIDWVWQSDQEDLLLWPRLVG